MKPTDESRLESLAWSVHAADCADPSRCDKHGWRCCTACTRLRMKITDEFHRLLTNPVRVLDRILSLARETTGDSLAMSDALAEIEREAARALEAAAERA